MADQPFFSIQEIHTLVRANDFAFANSRAQHRAQDLGWDNACVKAFLLAIRVAHFYKPFANQLAFDGRHKLHTDAYRMHFDEELLREIPTFTLASLRSLGFTRIRAGDWSLLSRFTLMVRHDYT